ncbi:MAG: hypothetical protein EOP10_19985 [Proteobacteria bacterium]|nr:MAG: hypothetical protein EOP10_19985 [Pseudomonadota bacterium]
MIYFIDANRTRTLKFSIGTSYLTVGALTVAVVWSLIATGLLIRDRFVIAEMSSHSKSLLDTVFNYQTRYDEVYEKAYPNPGENNGAVAQEDDLPVAETLKVADSGAKSKKKESANVEPQKSVLPVDEAAIAKDKGDSETAPIGLPIAIDNFASTLLGKNLTIRLSLKNLNSPTKSSGAISGTANFVDTNNQAHAIIGRPSRSGDEAEHFNIRYFKNKNLVFESPKDLAGRFTNVVVTIKDDTGRSKEFPYTVNKDVPQHAPTPTPVAVSKPEVMPAVSKADTTSPSESNSGSSEGTTSGVKVKDSAPSAESTDAIDTTNTSGETETTNDTSN